MRIHSVKAKTFKEEATILVTSISTILRRLTQQTKAILPEGVRLPKAIALDEFKADTNTGKYQLIIADAETHEPIDILSSYRLQTIKTYLQIYGQDVEIVVMDMSGSFRVAIQQGLGKYVITPKVFRYYRYVYWDLDDVRRKVQKEWHAYDRKKCKRMRHVLHKDQTKLTEEEH